jgi:hypothetical protein
LASADFVRFDPHRVVTDMNFSAAWIYQGAPHQVVNSLVARGESLKRSCSPTSESASRLFHAGFPKIKAASHPMKLVPLTHPGGAAGEQLWVVAV